MSAEERVRVEFHYERPKPPPAKRFDYFWGPNIAYLTEPWFRRFVETGCHPFGYDTVMYSRFHKDRAGMRIDKPALQSELASLCADVGRNAVPRVTAVHVQAQKGGELHEVQDGQSVCGSAYEVFCVIV